jgi:cytoskeleton-associated protein 5
MLQSLDTLRDETVGNLDLILKWFTVRFLDTNPSMLNKALEYLRRAFTMLVDMDYSLHEYEACSFIPYLIIKVIV